MGNAMTSFKKAFDKMFGNKEMRVRLRAVLPDVFCVNSLSLFCSVNPFFFCEGIAMRTLPPLPPHHPSRLSLDDTDDPKEHFDPALTMHALFTFLLARLSCSVWTPRVRPPSFTSFTSARF